MGPRLTARDQWLLATMLPLFAVVFAAHVEETARTGLAQLPVFAQWHPGDYPRVATYRLETDSSGSGLEPGDRLIRLGERDLRGAGYLSFDAIGLARTSPGRPVPLVFERDGRRQTVPLEARPHPQRWARIPILLLIPTFCVLILLRAPGQADVQRFYLCFMTYAISQAHFYGGPEWKTWLAGLVWNVSSSLMLLFMLRFARLFPPEMPAERRVPALLPWLVTGLFVVFVRANYFISWPLPIEWVPRVSFASHGSISLVGILVLSWNYLHARPAGRRRLRWLLLGTALGSLPVVAAGLAPLLIPQWQGFRLAFAAGYLSSTIWTLGALLGTVRDNTFDVDRLISATTAWSLAAAGAVAAIVLCVPLLGSVLALRLGLDETTTRLALAAGLGALVIPLGARLRPGVDRLLFPGRVGLQEGAALLVEELEACPDPEALLDLAGRRSAALFDARGVALYRRLGEGFERRHVRGLELPARLGELAGPLRIRPRNAPPELGPEVALVMPVSPGSRSEALVVLGPKRSGDIYTTNDAQTLTAIAARVETCWLRFQKQAADRESRAKTDLLAAASHDLRQPLHTVALLAEALQGRLDDPDVRSLVVRIGDSTQDLDEMLTGLLDRSKLDAGGVRPELRDLPLAEVFAQLERELSPQAEARGLRLRVVPTGLGIRSDPLLLVRILRNLLSNALRYAGPGAAVLLGARPRGERVRIEVRDSGPGIPVESQREIFQAFRQIGRGEGGGLGLGLSIVEGLAGLLGHEIELRSAPGRGSTFAVSARRARAASPAARPAHPGGLRAQVLETQRVLVVDDDPGVLRATLELLGSWGCEPQGASSLAEASDVLGSGWRPDLLIADYQLMNGETGLELLAQLRERLGSGLRAAVVTAETAPDVRERLAALDVPLLRKPIRPARLRALLSQSAGAGRAPRD